MSPPVRRTVNIHRQLGMATVAALVAVLIVGALSGLAERKKRPATGRTVGATAHHSVVMAAGGTRRVAGTKPDSRLVGGIFVPW